MLQGDNLLITLFFFTSAVLGGFEAMKAKGWRALAFWFLTAVFGIAGVAWYPLKDVYPPLTRYISEIATSPQSWFVLFVLGVVLLAATGRSPRSSRQSVIPTADADADLHDKIRQLADQIASVQPYDDSEVRQILNDTIKTLVSLGVDVARQAPDSENIRNLDRTAFLLSTETVDTLYRRRLEEALARLPQNPLDMPIDTNEKMKRETDRLQEYFLDLQENLIGSEWVEGCRYVIGRAEIEGNAELLRMDTPPELHPQHYRLFYVARLCRDKVERFLKQSITKARENERQMLQMLRERPSVHMLR
jgi:hypothetical protein